MSGCWWKLMPLNKIGCSAKGLLDTIRILLTSVFNGSENPAWKRTRPISPLPSFRMLSRPNVCLLFLASFPPRRTKTQQNLTMQSCLCRRAILLCHLTLCHWVLQFFLPLGGETKETKQTAQAAPPWATTSVLGCVKIPQEKKRKYVPGSGILCYTTMVKSE